MVNQERIRMFGEKENYKYLGILEANTIKQTEIKKKKKKKKKKLNEEKKYLRRTRKPLEIAEISSKG